MPATISIHNDAALVGEHWIEQDVVRIGSGADCDLRVPGLPEHALVVQYQNGGYRVFNRSSSEATLGKLRLFPMQPAAWRSRQRLVIGPFTLVLRHDADAAPCRKPVMSSVIASTTPGHSRRQSASQSKISSRRLTMIVGCLIAILLWSLAAGARTDSQAAAEFEGLVARLQAAAERDENASYLCQTLQQARYAERRSDQATAIQLYREIRNHLLDPAQPAPRFSSAEREQLYRFTMHRLGALSRH
jgi:hypothetical protein